MGQELVRRRIEQRPARPFAPAGGADPARVHQHVERALGNLHAADRLDLGAADRLVIGDDRQRLGRRARQPARLLARAAQQMREVGRGLEMPAPAALDQLDAAARHNGSASWPSAISIIALADMLRDLVDGQRRRPTRTGSLRPRGRTRPSGGPQPDRRERLVLGDVEPAAPGQLERGDEARGQRRAAELRVLRSTAGSSRARSSRAPCRSSAPTRSMRFLERHHRARRGRRASPAGSRAWTAP